MTDSGHPCFAPFGQLYLVPRETLDVRFCPYHKSSVISDQASLLAEGVNGLDRMLNEHAELSATRDAYLTGDYVRGAGCSPQCYWYQTWKEGGHSYRPEDYRGADGKYRVKRIWLSVGPDCNITCRYCLEPKKFHINYKTCDPSVMTLARDLVARGDDVLLTGGEPFFPKFGFVRVLTELAEGYDRKGLGRFDIQTNGTYLDEPVRGLLLRAPVSVVGISMDTLRPELFDYLRRGSRFEQVWSNARALVRERNAAGLCEPDVKVLCAVMKANHDHLGETVDRVVEEGMGISLNILFKAYFSPDFSSEQSLSTLSLSQLLHLADDIERIRERHGDDGPVMLKAFRGQLKHLIEQKRSGRETQVTLGTKEISAVKQLLAGGHIVGAAREMLASLFRKYRISAEATRKGNVFRLVRDGHFVAAAGKAMRVLRKKMSP